MGENMLDQILLRKHLLHERQQNSHTSRHLDPSVEQIIQAKIGQNAHRARQIDYLDLMSQVKHGNVLPSEQQLRFQQEHLQAQQLSMALRQQLGLEAQSAGSNAPDFFQQRQRISSHEEQLNHLQWNLAVKEQLHRGFVDPSLAFEKSTSLPTGAAGMNLDNVNARFQGLDMQEQRPYIHSTDQRGSISSGIYSHHPQFSDQFNASHLDARESFSSRNNGQLENSLIEAQMRQLHLDAERQNKEPVVTMASADSSFWASAGGDEEKSKRVLMDLLHAKLGTQSVQSSGVDHRHPKSSYRSGEPFRLFSESSSSNLPLNLLPDQQVGLNHPHIEGPQNSNSSNWLQDHLVNGGLNEQFNNLGNIERVSLRSNFGGLVEERSFLSGTNEIRQASYVDSSLIGMSTLDNDFSELEGEKGIKHGPKVKITTSRSVADVEDNLAVQEEVAMECGELPIDAPSRHTSLSSTGSYSYEMGLDKASVEEVSNDRMPSILSKGLDNSLLKRPPVSRALSSQDVSSELASAPFVKQKNPMGHATSDEGKRETIGIPATVHISETQASGKRDAHFRRTSSCSDATVSETSFIDMLKKPVPEADAVNGAALESSDGGPQVGRSGKKKGKKGRQIDPALLGFKVSSNRIMMGEIQRLED
ncbi:hypothetical protein L1049_002682 [Liquidambar formosana]|uniref:Uncharacterized protein n=1 Tax=Liquidambar formosana TaxID=63359 RepID=A0AAP0R9D2_LIQFO